MNLKKRSPDQTATAFSMSRQLFEAMELARARLHMDRSNFVRYCVAKELAALGGEVSRAVTPPRAADPAFPAVPKVKLYDQDLSTKLSVAESAKDRSPRRRRAAESTASLRPDSIRDRGGVATPYPTAPPKRRQRKA